jgi:hypothetical protein
MKKVKYIPCEENELTYHKHHQKKRAGKAGQRIRHRVNGKKRT